MLFHGRGCQRDLQAASALWRKTAEEHDHARAQYCLGRLYECGDDERQIVPDPAEAERWYSRAAAQGFEKAKEPLARLQAERRTAGGGSPRNGAGEDQVPCKAQMCFAISSSGGTIAVGANDTAPVAVSHPRRQNRQGAPERTPTSARAAAGGGGAGGAAARAEEEEGAARRAAQARARRARLAAGRAGPHQGGARAEQESAFFAPSSPSRPGQASEAAGVGAFSGSEHAAARLVGPRTLARVALPARAIIAPQT